MNRTRASEILKERFAGHGEQERFRVLLNDGQVHSVDPPTVSRWFNGKLRPSLEQIVRINDVLRAEGLDEITITLWAEVLKETA